MIKDVKSKLFERLLQCDQIVFRRIMREVVGSGEGVGRRILDKLKLDVVRIVEREGERQGEAGLGDL